METSSRIKTNRFKTMKNILYDSNKCIWKRDFGYDSMSLKEFDEYASIAVGFVGHFVVEYESISVEVNRIERKFRIIVEHVGKNNIYDYGFGGLDSDYYENGNIKWMDNFFGILNNEYGLAANNLRIPQFPTSNGDQYYEWWILARQFRDFKIGFEAGTDNGIYDKINKLRDKYFTHWIMLGFD